MIAVLGLNAFHADSTACLAVDGKLVGAVAEELLGERQKHTSRFPDNDVRWLLQDAGLRSTRLRTKFCSETPRVLNQEEKT